MLSFSRKLCTLNLIILNLFARWFNILLFIIYVQFNLTQTKGIIWIRIFKKCANLFISYEKLVSLKITWNEQNASGYLMLVMPCKLKVLATMKKVMHAQQFCCCCWTASNGQWAWALRIHLPESLKAWKKLLGNRCSLLIIKRGETPMIFV